MMKFKSIYSELKEGNLFQALSLLQTKVDNLGDWELREDYEKVFQTYTTMLSFFSQGVEDPNALALHTNLIQKTYSINDRVNRLIALKRTPQNKYCQTYTSCLTDSISIQATQSQLETMSEQLHAFESSPNKRESIQKHDMEDLLNQHDKLLGKLFNHTWTADLWTTSNYNEYTDLLLSEQILTEDKAVVIGALTLACYELFDPQKLMLLFDLYLVNDIEVSQRAIISLILLVIRYDNRLKYYPQIKSRFNLYCENKQFTDDCFCILMQLQYSKLTDTVSDKMINDILPSILQSSKYKIIDFNNVDPEFTKNGENPEWIQNSKDDSKAEKKIHQMADMQTEGADVYWSSFRSIKGTPFFHQFHHWFLPFTFNQPEAYQFTINTPPEIVKITKSLFLVAPFCSSDMYSFIFMLGSLQKMGQDVIVNQIQSQLNEEGIQDFFQNHIQPKQKPQDVSRKYIFDLYRVFKAYPFHTQMFDPFNKQLAEFSPLYYDIMQPLTTLTDQILALAEFMMRRGLYQEAFLLFSHLQPKEQEEDADLWQKLGFCLQKLGEGKSALEKYQIAYQLNPQSKWTIQHIAQTAFETADYNTSLTYINMILENDEDNLKWLYRKAECLFGLNRYADCMPTLYQLAYLDESSLKAQEMLAWGLIMTGQTEKAEKIHREMAENNPSVIHHVNLAHLILLRNDIHEAYNHYLEAYRLSKDLEEFQKAFNQWSAYTEQIGLDANRLHLMHDSVLALDPSSQKPSENDQ